MHVQVLRYRVREGEVEGLAEYIRRSLRPVQLISFTFTGDHRRGLIVIELEEGVIRVSVEAFKDIVVECEGEGETLSRALKIISHAIRRFTEGGQGHLYLVFTDRMEFSGSPSASVKDKILACLMSTNIIYLLISFMIVAALVFALEEYAPLVLVALQYLVLAFSDKIFLRIGKWRLGPDNRNIYIIKLSVPEAQFKEFLSSVMPRVNRVKEELFKTAIAPYGDVNLFEAGVVLTRQGLGVFDFKLGYKKVDAYGIVEEVCSKAGLDQLKVAVLNTIIPNAAATGLGGSRSVMLLTSGLIALCEEDEVRGVIAHEVSHIIYRDPLVLSSLVAAEYLTRVYLVAPVILALLPFEGLIPLIALAYFMVAITLVFFIAKIFEARADMHAARIIGSAEYLASALEKIGWRRLRAERGKLGKLRAWLAWNPHPPVYFRLKLLRSGVWREGNLFAIAAKECVKEFLSLLLH